MHLENIVIELSKKASAAARKLAIVPTHVKDEALKKSANNLRQKEATLLGANEDDVHRGRSSGLSAAMLDRLTLTKQRIEDMADGLERIAVLPDPVEETISTVKRPNGLEIKHVRVPLGVVGIIYESRPNVTADAAGLCVKAGNAVILKGGSEAFKTNGAIVDALDDGFREAGLPDGVAQLVRSTDRRAVSFLLEQDRFVDVIIPRGGEELIREVTRASSIPVIQHFSGLCHIYVDEYADVLKAMRLCMNAKVQRPWVCNAIENLLVHEAVAKSFLPDCVRQLEDNGVEVRGCDKVVRLVPHAKRAEPEDWTTEYLDKILSIKIVDSIEEAIEFINTVGSGLADAIVSESYTCCRKFLREVDSATVYANASTRFTDGYEFGFGAEVGISTNRLHARGPMGLRELTTGKYVVYGDGQIRE